MHSSPFWWGPSSLPVETSMTYKTGFINWLLRNTTSDLFADERICPKSSSIHETRGFRDETIRNKIMEPKWNFTKLSVHKITSRWNSAKLFTVKWMARRDKIFVWTTFLGEIYTRQVYRPVVLNLPLIFNIIFVIVLCLWMYNVLGYEPYSIAIVCIAVI